VVVADCSDLGAVAGGLFFDFFSGFVGAGAVVAGAWSGAGAFGAGCFTAGASDFGAWEGAGFVVAGCSFLLCFFPGGCDSSGDGC
jgi:hypothetical protein